MTKTTKDVLIEAKALIEKGWTQGRFARAADGEATDAHDLDAVCWCMSGAVERAAGRTVGYFWDAKNAIRDLVPDGSIIDFNDNPKRTKEEVLAVFDKAIAAQS